MHLSAILSAHHLRNTKPRQAVFAALQRAAAPLTISHLIAQCSTIDRTSIYRTLQLFTRHGIVSVVPIGWKRAYELAEPFMPHHHHLQCTRCRRLIDIQTPELEQLIAAISQRHHFQPTDHHFEINGFCHSCQHSTAN